MDITVYLPNRLGKLAKEEGLNLSRMLREAVIDELANKGITWDSEFVTVEEATELIREILEDGDWHPRRELGERLGTKVKDAHFGYARKALGIELRRVGGGKGSYVAWRLPKASHHA